MKIRNRTLIRLAAKLIAVVSRLLFRSVRLDIQAHPQTTPYEETGRERYLHCIWHDGLAGMVFSRPAIRAAALVSQHADGSYLSDALEAIGVKPIRGSSR